MLIIPMYEYNHPKLRHCERRVISSSRTTEALVMGNQEIAKATI